MDESSAIPKPLLKAKRLRSCLLMRCGSICNAAPFDQLFAKFKLLRALRLQALGIKKVSHVIGELKHLRYLDLSSNEFESLPNSMTSLVNLLALYINECKKLKALPDDLRKLINLRYLNIEGCWMLKHMPSGLGEMSCLQHLSNFKLGRAASGVEEGVKSNNRSGLDALARLQHQLRGKLSVEFEDGIDEEEDCAGDECKWLLPVSPQQLSISNYPGRRIPDCGINGRTINSLASLELSRCGKVKYLPPLRCFPNLRYLTLTGLMELEHVEEEEENQDRYSCTTIGGSNHNNASSSRFFPRLEKLKFELLPKLKGWWRKVASTSSTAPPHFPLLSQLSLHDCPMLELKSFPLCPHLRVLSLFHVGDNEVTQQQLSSTTSSSSSSSSSVSLSSPASTFPPDIEQIEIWNCKWLRSFQDEAVASLRCLDIMNCGSLKSLHLASQHLQTIQIYDCNELRSFELLVEAPIASLRVLEIGRCKRLKSLHIAAHLNALEELTIIYCPELELWESQDESRCHLDWDCFTNLRQLRLNALPPAEKLPHSLRQRHALGKLNITEQQRRRFQRAHIRSDVEDT